MAENMMSSDHKATNPNYRNGYDKMEWDDKRKDNELGVNPKIGFPKKINVLNQENG